MLACRKRREPAVHDWLCRVKRIAAMMPSTAQSSFASGNTIDVALAPELERYGHDAPGGLLHDELPHLGGAGERELAHAGVGAESRPAILAIAGEDVEHRGRQVLLADCGEGEHAEGSVLGRLQHDRVPGTQAGAILRAARSTGAFQGMIAPTTPMGSRRV